MEQASSLHKKLCPLACPGGSLHCVWSEVASTDRQAAASMSWQHVGSSESAPICEAPCAKREHGLSSEQYAVLHHLGSAWCRLPACLPAACLPAQAAMPLRVNLHCTRYNWSGVMAQGTRELMLISLWLQARSSTASPSSSPTMSSLPLLSTIRPFALWRSESSCFMAPRLGGSMGMECSCQ